VKREMSNVKHQTSNVLRVVICDLRFSLCE
jgi:hypothetical protein